MKFSFSFLFFFFPFLIFAQLKPSTINDLEVELTNKVNELRVSLGVKPLENDRILRRAAQHQSSYMARRDELTHTQRGFNNATPTKRVLLKGGKDFELVGENILYSTPQKPPLNKKEITALAIEMFESWKDSPGHYANMIDPEYTFGDFGFKIHTKKNIIYATQVFGKKGHRVDQQMSDNAFGLTQGPGDCDDDVFSNLLANMGNAIYIEGNKIKLYDNDIADIERVIKVDNDGFAVDIISREQIMCGQANELDFSPIYDGVLLKPVYRSELLGNNQAIGDYRFITTIGEIPEYLEGQDLSASLVFIKDGEVCKYLVPCFVPSKNYELRPIQPIVNNPSDVKLKTSGIVATQEVIYDFNTNITKPVSFPDLENLPYDIASVLITSYSSVEGDSVKNADLHNARAQTIKTHIVSNVKIDDELFNIAAIENWPLMNFQLSYFGKDDWINLSHDSLKNLIASKDQSIPWDSLLFAQRKAMATIYYYGELGQEDSVMKIEELNVRTAIENGDFNLANKALYELYHKNELDPTFIFETTLFDKFYEHPELVQNGAAILSKIYKYDIQKATRFIFNWMNRKEDLSENAKYNLLHLYTLTGSYLLEEWDITAERLSKVLYPDKVKVLSNAATDVELLLNLHLTFIQYFGQINNSRDIQKSFDYIATYFRAHSLSPESDVDLALFFNKWSMYHLTIDYLQMKFNNDELNEDGVFTFAQTVTFYLNDQVDDYEVIHQKALDLNKTRWCNWLNQDYQIMRDHKVKRMYCKFCE